MPEEEFDVVVKVPPKKVRLVKLKSKKIEKGFPRVVEQEDPFEDEYYYKYEE